MVSNTCSVGDCPVSISSLYANSPPILYCASRRRLGVGGGLAPPPWGPKISAGGAPCENPVGAPKCGSGFLLLLSHFRDRDLPV